MRLDFWSAIRSLIFGIVVVLCVLAGAAKAEVVRVAVGDVQLKSNGQTHEDAEGLAVLWRSLLENSLSEFDSIEVLEREDIAAILKEAQLSLSSLADSESRLRVQKLLGADFIVLAEMNAGQKTCEVSVRLVSARESSVEGTFNIKVDAERIEEEADKLAGEICKSALEAFAGKRIVDLVAVLDFENKSPLARNDWLETSMARRLRQKLRTLPGLRTLEREEVDLLLQEVRLGAGGFIEGGATDAGTNGNSGRRFLVTGFYDEYQPLDKALHFEFTVLVQNIDSKKRNTRRFVFESDRLGKGVEDIVPFIEEQILGKESLSQQEQAKEPDIAQDPLSQALACLDDETAQALLALDKQCKDDPRRTRMRDTIIKNIIEQSSGRNQPGGSAYESKVNFEKALAELGVRSQDGLKKETYPATGSQPAPLPQYNSSNARGMQKLYRFLRTDNDRTMWNFSYGGSSSIYNSGYMKKVARKATVKRAIRYLKAAVMLNGDNVLAKELLSVLLSDRQIGNVDLATEFAREIVARYPDSPHQEGALGFLIGLHRTDIKRVMPYLEVLIEKYPGRTQVSCVRRVVFGLCSQKNMSHEEKLKLNNRFTEILLSAKATYDLTGCIRNTFKLTQADEKYYTLGDSRIESLVNRHPDMAAQICFEWTWCWNRRNWDWTDSWDFNERFSRKAIHWSRYGLEIYQKMVASNGQTNNTIFYELNYWLGLNLFETGQYSQALEAFGKLKDCRYASIKGPTPFLKGVCLYQLGRYEDALKLLEDKGKYSFDILTRSSALLKTRQDGDAQEWAGRCRQKLGAQEKKTASAAKPAVVDHWRQLDTRLPISTRISVLGWDGEGIWMGTNLRTNFDQMISRFNAEDAARELRNYNERVVLARFNPATSEVQAFRGTQLSSPWISCILACGGRVWVGTEGGGLNVYDPGNDTWTNITDSRGLPSNYVQCLKPDGSFLWIGTGDQTDGAVARYDLESGNIHTFLPRDYPGQIPPPTCHVYGIEISGEYVWFALGSKGIARYDKDDDSWSYFSKDLDGQITKQNRISRHNSYLWNIDSIAAFNDRIWFASSKYQNPKSVSREIDFTLEDRAVFSCDMTGDDFRSLSLKDGLPKAEIASMQAEAGRLFLGTAWPLTVGTWKLPGPYGLLIMNKDGAFQVFEATEVFRRKPRSVGLEQILVLENEVWATVGNTLKVLKYR